MGDPPNQWLISTQADHGAGVEAHSAEIFDVVRAIYEDAVNPNDGLYDGDTFDCVVRPRLVGQVTWREEESTLEGGGGELGYPGHNSSI